MEFGVETNLRSIGINDLHLHGNRPYAALAEHIVLPDGDAINVVLRVAGPHQIHLRHAAMANPHLSPILQRLP